MHKMPSFCQYQNRNAEVGQLEEGGEKLKRKRLIVTGMLLCLLLNVKYLSVLAAETVSKQEWIETDWKAEGRNIILTVKIVSGSNVTSGRIAVYYPEKMIKLEEIESGNLWKLEDINTQIEQDGKKGVSYAWADTKKLADARNLFKISFEATEEANGKELTIETELLELFSEETMAMKPKKLTDTIKINFGSSEDENSGTNPSTPQDNIDNNTNNDTDNGTNDTTENSTNNNTENSTNNNINHTTNAKLHTGDTTNLAGYLLLGFGAIMVIVEEGKKRK